MLTKNIKPEDKQITLRMPFERYEALKAEAKEIGISMNELILLKLNPLKFDCPESK